MESTGQAFKIHVSPDFANCLKEIKQNEYTLTKRGSIQVKVSGSFLLKINLKILFSKQIILIIHIQFQGKGEMETYWLNSTN